MNNRQESLLPNGIPKYIRVYDHPTSYDRYTVVFTGRYKGREYGGCDYVAMSDDPFSPQGFCIHGGENHIIDKPSYKHLGKKISYEDLPDDCKEIVMRDYKEIWRLE